MGPSTAPSNKYTRLVESLTPSQKMAAISPDNVVVRAAAGSGKTTVLVARFIESFKAELERGNEKSIADVLASIAAITFTEKAASEMKGRIRCLLIDGLKNGPARGQRAGAWRQAQDAMSQCNIGTIHSFCASVLRRFPLEAGLDPEFGILDETASFLMRREAVESLFSGHGEVGARETLTSPFAVYPRQKAIQLLLPVVERIETLLPHLTLYAEAPPDAIARKIEELLNHTSLESSPNKDDAGAYDPLQEAARLKVLAQGALLAHSVYTARKHALSLLDFEDLQTTLLELLSRPEGAILERLKEELTTIMIDEFQDTDRFQWALARTLSSTTHNVIKQGKLFVVGDERQSIYRFRGADLRAFRDATAEIEGCAGATVEMQENFRSLPNIIGFINLVFAGDSESQRPSSRPMIACRRPHPDTHTGTVELLFRRPEGAKKDNVRAEAELLARRIVAMAEPENPMRKNVFDTTKSELRPCRYEDIALLMRARTHLSTYQDVLRRDGIPFSIAGGLGFYERQEIKDVCSLLEVVLDPNHDVALAGLLRSPFFAVSDDGLFWLSSSSSATRRDARLWDKLGALDQRGAASAASWPEPVLDPVDQESLRLARELVGEAARRAPAIGPAAVIRLLLRRTGALAAYSAQPDGAQCVANLEKIDDILSASERTGHRSLGAVIRLLERLSTEEVREAEAQPYSEAGDGVKIMTIHAAKGLEFPVVVVVDVFAEPYWGMSDQAYVDPELGLGLRVPAASIWGKQVNTRLRDAIRQRLKQAAADEQKRLWYVACTRARDHLLLSGTIGLKPNDALGFRALKLLGATPNSPDSPACEAVSVAVRGLERPVSLFTSRDQIPHAAVSRGDSRGLIEWLDTAALDPAPPDAQVAAQPRLRYLPTSLPARFAPQVSPSDLDTYWACPRRYLLDRILGPALMLDAPRAAADSELMEAHGAEFGALVHEVLMQLDFADDAQDDRLLAALTNAPDGAASSHVLRNLLSTFRSSPLCEALRSSSRVRREVPFVLRRGTGVLRGRIDLLYEDEAGRMCVVDYKTDRDSSAIVMRYKAQLTAYGFTVASLYGLPPDAVSVAIYLARTGELVPVPMDANAFAWVTSLMDELCKALENARHRAYSERFPERPEACDDCYAATRQACFVFRHV
ncbi:MAG: UvrD-helicase domain-containing protein [Candidatus Coatesbacteria bacterium]|nr:UvrD-helicase domain-containing protein [Candidatus Coatesbacteria bacterium]